MINSKVICIGEALVDRLGMPGRDPSFDKGFDDLDMLITGLNKSQPQNHHQTH